MLAGRAAFEGETLGEILGSVFKAEPDWSQLPAETPESIRRLLRRCLQKEPNLRVRDIRDARIEIDDSKSGPPVNSLVVQRVSRTRERFAWISALLGLVLVAGALALRRAPDVSVKPAQFVILPPEGENFTAEIGSQAISPDGRQVVFAAAAADGVPMLWVRPLDSLATRPLAGTVGGKHAVLVARQSRYRILRARQAEKNRRRRRVAPTPRGCAVRARRDVEPRWGDRFFT